MNIVTVSFEEPLIITINDQTVQLVAFKTQEHGNVKFGVQAPRSINVHREEIYHAIKQKQQAALEESNKT
jgi:carbon storage regulator